MSDTLDSFSFLAMSPNNSKNYEAGWMKVKLVCQCECKFLNHRSNYVI